GEDVHAVQHRPEDGHHDHGGDAQGDGHQERDLHDRPGVDALQRQAHPTRTGAPDRTSRGTTSRSSALGTGQPRRATATAGTRGRGAQVTPRGGPGHGTVAHPRAVPGLGARTADFLGLVPRSGRAQRSPRRTRRDALTSRAHYSPPVSGSSTSAASSLRSSSVALITSSTSADPSDGSASSWGSASSRPVEPASSGVATLSTESVDDPSSDASGAIDSTSSDSAVSALTATATIESPLPSVANRTPAVWRPVTRTWSMEERTTLPRSMTTSTSLPSSTRRAPTRQ